MTRVGRKLIKVPAGTNVAVNDGSVVVQGPKGTLKLSVDPVIKVNVSGDQIVLENTEVNKQSSAKHGLYRALINNLVTGVSTGFSKDLELVGVGYRVALQGNSLVFSLGYSHPVTFDAPDGIQFTVEGQTKIKVSGIDNQVVGQTVADIIKLRKPDAYKAKGIRRAGQVIKTKPGKSVKK